MPVDFTGYWKMLANENFEEYLRALDVNVALRKIANLLKPDKEIVQNGDHMIIRTLSTFRNYIMDFQVGEEFEEDLTGIDDRKCMTTVSWDGDKLECVQKGEKEGRGWTQWIEGDELHLEMRVQGVVCKQVFKKVKPHCPRTPPALERGLVAEVMVCDFQGHVVEGYNFLLARSTIIQSEGS
ncbi:retinol-binding protein 1 [Balaenoptera ricei]|uniref:retinol-binding protein 1 n=1 Tax=Balaenoptera ricei TaxID=2746895 RepID=UPI0028BD9098|nr:retinol-binding protein 1 [Balaenoptera ricei]